MNLLVLFHVNCGHVNYAMGCFEAIIMRVHSFLQMHSGPDAMMLFFSPELSNVFPMQNTKRTLISLNFDLS